MRAALLALMVTVACPAGAEVLSLRDPLPADLAGRTPSRVVMDPAEVPPGGLVYALRLPAKSDLLALPQDALLVLADCAAPRDPVPVRIAIPTRCEPQAVADALAAADGVGIAGRLARLGADGFEIFDPVRPAPDAGLVITAMPLESLPVTSLTVVEAGIDPLVAEPSGDPAAVAAPEPMLSPPVQPQAQSDVFAPARPGLPEPSIVLGDMAVLMTAGARGPFGFAQTVREAIRQRDPAMFERLLGQGSFDPDPDQLAATIQTELARMGCYSGPIDGTWGGGSDSALRRYISAGGGAQAGSAPDVALFRVVARQSSVTCATAPVAARASTPGSTPASAAASPRAAQASSGQARRSGAPVQQSRGRPAATAPASQAPAAQGRQINRSVIGSGVFR